MEAQRLYSDYLAQKNAAIAGEPSSRRAVDALALASADINGTLFAFQRAIVAWALQQKRAAVFADTGLGKSRIELSYAEAVARTSHDAVIIFTPLCAAQQLKAEAANMGLTTPVAVVRSMADVARCETGSMGDKICIANYEIADKFDISSFISVVLDESSILKHQECKTGQWLIRAAQSVPFKLCLTATPCPNDYAEIMNQSAFLGIATQHHLLNSFFVRVDVNKVKLRPYAVRPFAKWLSTWSVWVSSPADIGFPSEAARYQLPGLDVRTEVVHWSGGAGGGSCDNLTDAVQAKKLAGLQNRITARRLTLHDRVQRCVDIVNAAADEHWVVWCTLNDESKLLAQRIRGAVELTGTDAQAKKDAALSAFSTGAKRVLVTKSEIAGFGLNWQHCCNMIFVSLTDSYERMYQAIRRCYRFGQERIVNVILLTTDIERPVQENLARKEKETDHIKSLMKQKMQQTWRCSSNNNINLPSSGSTTERQSLSTTVVECGSARMILGDCVQGMMDHVGDASVDYIIFSPPFQSLFRYSSHVSDVSNCQTETEFEHHMAFVARELFRVLKPGRLMSFHCMAIPRRRLEHGEESVHSIIDVRGQLTRVFEAAGFLMQSEVCVFRDPIQALIRTKAQGLFYKSFIGDASIVRQALPDYVVTLRKPGINAAPIKHDPSKHSMEEWIRLASPVWFINHNDTLNIKKMLSDAPMCKKTTEALLAGLTDDNDEDAGGSSSHENDDDDGDDDEDDEHVAPEDQKHPTPLQLPVIENCVSLWSNPGDTILDPFSGIGSTGHVCKKLDRSYVGIELAPRYFEASLVAV